MDTSTAATSDDLKTDIKEDKEDKEDKVITFLLIYTYVHMCCIFDTDG